MTSQQLDLEPIRADLDQLDSTWNGVRLACHAKLLLAEVERLRGELNRLSAEADSREEAAWHRGWGNALLAERDAAQHAPHCGARGPAAGCACEGGDR